MVRLTLNNADERGLKMQKKVCKVLGVLLIASSTTQIASAAGHHARKAERAPIATTQQFRDAHGSLNGPSTPRERHGLPAPAAVGNKSCDIIPLYSFLALSPMASFEFSALPPLGQRMMRVEKVRNFGHR
jgi:hypothetical protein